MPERTPLGRLTLVQVRRLQRVLKAPRRHPRKAQITLRDALLGTIAAFVLLTMFIWDPLVTDLVEDKLPAELISEGLIVFSPLDFLVYQALVTVVVGALIGTARIGTYYLCWRRQNNTLPDRWTESFFTGASVICVATIVGTYQFLVPVLAETITTTAVLPGYATATHPYIWAMIALILCVSCGVASLFAFAMVALTFEGIESFTTVVCSGVVALIVSLVFGYVAWPLGILSTFAWGGPLLVGYTLGISLALIGTRMRRRGGDCSAPLTDNIS